MLKSVCVTEGLRVVKEGSQSQIRGMFFFLNHDSKVYFYGIFFTSNIFSVANRTRLMQIARAK